MEAANEKPLTVPTAAIIVAALSMSVAVTAYAYRNFLTKEEYLQRRGEGMEWRSGVESKIDKNSEDLAAIRADIAAIRAALNRKER